MKVDPARAKDPARHVSKVLKGCGSDGTVEEVFPGLRQGASAGLVSVDLAGPPSTRTAKATVKALQDDEAIAYVQTPKPRRAL